MPMPGAASNKRAPGIDGQDFADIEAYGVEQWLAELALALRQEARIVIRPTRGQRHIALARRRYASVTRYSSSSDVT
jgi:hypothetical protein